MKVILNRDVSNLGEEGDIVNVSSGYARNYLLPGGMVMQYNAQNLSMIEARRASIEKRKDEKRQDAASLKDRLENEALVIRMVAGENGRLFGSVTGATIAEELEKKGLFVEKKRIDIPDSSLKSVGNHKVRIRLYGEQEAVLTVQVEGQPSGHQASKGAPPKKEAAPAVEEEVAVESEADVQVEATAEAEGEADAVDTDNDASSDNEGESVQETED